jgi:hypothetical protein
MAGGTSSERQWRDVLGPDAISDINDTLTGEWVAKQRDQGALVCKLIKNRVWVFLVSLQRCIQGLPSLKNITPGLQHYNMSLFAHIRNAEVQYERSSSKMVGNKRCKGAWLLLPDSVSLEDDASIAQALQLQTDCKHFTAYEGPWKRPRTDNNTLPVRTLQ